MSAYFRNLSQLPWWVKITTVKPCCTYYFGPFSQHTEATVAEYSYIEDLIAEKAQGISTEIVQDSPQKLTIEN